MWRAKSLFFYSFLCFAYVKSQDFQSDNGKLEAQIGAVLNHLNSKPAQVYDYNYGTLVSGQKKTDGITELFLDISVGCRKTIYPDLPCSPQTLICHAFVKSEVDSYQVMSDVTCSPKIEVSVENVDDDREKPAPPLVQIHDGYQGGNRNLDLSIEPVSQEQGIDFVAFRKSSVPCLGCPYDLNTDAIGVEDLLKTALRHIETEKTQRHTVVNVRRLQQQVVAGMKYFVLMEVGRTICPKDADISQPCPLDSSAETTLCQVMFIEKPWISKLKHIIQNNCTVSQEYSPKGDDIDNELSPFGGVKKASKKPLPNYNVLANGNLDGDEMNPARLADLEAQILMDPFVAPAKPPTIFVGDDLKDNYEENQNFDQQMSKPDDHFQPIETQPLIVDEEEPEIEILLPPAKPEESTTTKELKQKNSEENFIIRQQDSPDKDEPNDSLIVIDDARTNGLVIVKPNLDEQDDTTDTFVKNNIKKETENNVSDSSESESRSKASASKESKAEEQEVVFKRNAESDSDSDSEQSKRGGEDDSEQNKPLVKIDDSEHILKKQESNDESGSKESAESHEQNNTKNKRESKDTNEEEGDSKSVDSAESHEKVNSKKVKRLAFDTDKSPEEDGDESGGIDSAESNERKHKPLVKRDTNNEKDHDSKDKDKDKNKNSSESDESNEKDKDKNKAEKQRSDEKSSEESDSKDSSEKDKDKDKKNNNDEDNQNPKKRKRSVSQPQESAESLGEFYKKNKRERENTDEEGDDSKSKDSAESHEKVNSKKVRREALSTNPSEEHSEESGGIDSAESREGHKRLVKRETDNNDNEEDQDKDNENKDKNKNKNESKNSSESDETSQKDKIKNKSEKRGKDEKGSDESNSKNSSEEDKDKNKDINEDHESPKTKDVEQNDIRKKKRSVGQLEKITAEEKVIVRDLADFAAVHLDKMDDDNYKRVILQILGAKRVKLDAIYYQIILRLGISVCSEHDHNEKCREKLFTNLTKICKVQVRVDEDYLNAKVVKSQCQNIKKDENDRNRTNYSRYKRGLVGGHSPLAVDDPIVKDFVNASLLHLDSKIDGENKHKAIEVISATKQVVSGMSYNVKVKLGESTCKKSEPQSSDSCDLVEGKEPIVCDINVWDRPWLNKRQFSIKCGEDIEYTFAAESKRIKRSLLGGEETQSVVHPKASKFIKLGLEYLASKSEYAGRYNLKSIQQVTKQGVSGVLWKIEALINVCPVLTEDYDFDCKEEVCRFHVYDEAWLIDGLQINIKCDNDDNTYSFKPGSEISDDGDTTVQKHMAKAFSQFVSKHRKVYKNKEEYNYRMKVFRDNLGTIARLNKYDQGTGRYGITQFADMTAKEFSSSHGLRRDLTNENEMPFVKANIPNITLPTEFDWRTKGAVSEVKNQGSCGSCWAFSVTGNVEGQYAIKHGKLVSLSEQELVDCDKQDQGCNGGLMDNAYRQIEKLGGLELESEYPYDAKDEKCHFNKNKVAVQLSGAVNISQDETEMAKWLVKNGPISIAINANAMQFYVGGVSHPWKMLCSPKSLDHGVLIVGYGVHTYKLFNRTLPYWIIKNSWGTEWGEQGYYRVYRGDGTCGLNQTPSSAIVV